MDADTGARDDQGQPAPVPAVPPGVPVALEQDGALALIHPDTGEVIDTATATPDVLADYLESIAAWLQNAHDAVEYVEEERTD